MKKLLILSALLAATFAYAGDNCNKGTCNNTGGENYGGSGIGFGVGIAGAESSAKASSESNANAAAIQGQIQGQQQAQTATGGASNSTAYGGKGGAANATGGGGGQGGAGGSSNATGGTSNAAGGIGGAGGVASATGNGSGNSTSVNVGGSNYREAAQSLYLPPVVDRPLKDCRLYISLGGSSRDGQIAGGIPIGNSQICLSDVQWTLMTKVNAMKPGSFTPEDFLLVACKVEGMNELSACKQE
jgi:hypothetical protein